MKELEFQTIVCKAVRAAGGFGIKMSHRFLVGVPDLLVHPPGGPTMCLEAKFDRISLSSRMYTLELTPKQGSTLRQMADAGMLAGVVSLLEANKQFGFRAVRIGQFRDDNELRLSTLTYTWCQRRDLADVVLVGLRELAAVGVITRELNVA